MAYIEVDSYFKDLIVRGEVTKVVLPDLYDYDVGGGLIALDDVELPINITSVKKSFTDLLTDYDLSETGYYSVESLSQTLAFEGHNSNTVTIISFSLL